MRSLQAYPPSRQLLRRAVLTGALVMSLMVGAPASVMAANASHLLGPAPAWLALPFVILLLMIATGPLLYADLWERRYREATLLLALPVCAWYASAGVAGTALLRHTLEEYLSFIALVASLFVVAGGVLIRVDREASPAVNLLLLLAGAVISNVVGTTGASMLLIRPYLRVNEGRLRPFHVVFFIFIVGNIGGALTPVGDPPLFLGFLRGVPFFWVLLHLWLPWAMTLAALLILFLFLDLRVGRVAGQVRRSGKVEVKGRRNLLYLIPLIASIFLDPAVFPGLPSLQALLHLPFGLREAAMAIIAVAAWKTSNREALRSNGFDFEPVKEVAYLFAGIFVTMVPALQLIAAWAGEHATGFTLTKFYWCTGMLSGVLDNAPTYLNFLSGALGKFGLDAGDPAQVALFARGVPSPVPGDAPSQLYLMAVSMASVFFGALTYIGNAPNFMVRNIAARSGADMPDFTGYIVRYSLPVLVPLFTAIWLVLFNR